MYIRTEKYDRFSDVNVSTGASKCNLLVVGLMYLNRDRVRTWGERELHIVAAADKRLVTAVGLVKILSVVMSDMQRLHDEGEIHTPCTRE